MAGTKKVVLIVEDNEDISALLALFLRSYNCQVLATKEMTGVEELVRKHPVELLLLDIMLPEGADAGRRIAKNLRARGYSFPIYFMTGLRKQEIGEDFLSLVNGVLRKPFSIRELKELLHQALGSRAFPAGKAFPGELMGLLAALATEQEEIRRQQARLANFLTVLQDPERKGTLLSPEMERSFRDDCQRYEEGLGRLENAVREIREFLHQHAPELRKKTRSP